MFRIKDLMKVSGNAEKKRNLAQSLLTMVGRVSGETKFLMWLADSCGGRGNTGPSDTNYEWVSLERGGVRVYDYEGTWRVLFLVVELWKCRG